MSLLGILPPAIALKNLIQEDLLNRDDNSGVTLSATTYKNGASSGLSSRAAAPSYNQDDMSYLNDQESQLNQQFGRTDTTLNQGITQLNDSFNKERSGANQRRSRALEDFAIQGERSALGKDEAISRAEASARGLADSVRRRLGLAFDSGSAKDVANQAIAREASDNRSSILENFGENDRTLDLSKRRANEDFDSLIASLDEQRKERESKLRAGVMENQNAVSGSLAEIARQKALLKGGGYDQVKAATAPIQAQMNERNTAIDKLFDQFRTPYSVKNVEVKTPSLKDYTVDKIAMSQQGNTGQDMYDPYLNMLRRKEEQQIV